MTKRSYISQIYIEEDGLPPPTPEIQHERNLAVYDILAENKFSLNKRLGNSLPSSPYILRLAIKNSRLTFLLEDKESPFKYELHLSLVTLRPIIKDYFEICKS